MIYWLQTIQITDYLQTAASDMRIIRDFNVSFSRMLWRTQPLNSLFTHRDGFKERMGIIYTLFFCPFKLL